MPTSDAHIDPWFVVKLGDDHHLFGFAQRHEETGGLSWIRSSPLVDMDVEAGTATTASGRRYTLGRPASPADMEGVEPRLAFQLLVEQADVPKSPDDLRIRWLSCQKMGRHLGVEPPRLARDEVEAFIVENVDAYRIALGHGAAARSLN